MFLCNCPRFCVSLVCGPQPERDDIAFQLTTHFDTSWVVRNSKLNKEWGAEEGAAARNFPFQRQQPFTIEIFTSPSSYVVSPKLVHRLIIDCCLSAEANFRHQDNIDLYNSFDSGCS